MNTSEKLDNFMEKEGLNSLDLINPEDEGSFSHWGCEICNDGLGNLIYDCHGYNPTTGEIQEVYQICRQCLYLHANGEEIE